MRHLAFAATMLATAAGAIAVTGAPLRAQVTTVDEGSFTITRAGERAGHEDFRIRRTAAGAAAGGYVASATLAWGDRRIAPDLRTDARGGLLGYRVETRVGEQMQERLRGAVERGRFTAVVTTPRGESAKEYVVSDGALVLDDDVFHQYYFVAARLPNGDVPVVVPRRGAQAVLHVRSAGADPVEIDGRSVAATHLVVDEPGGRTRDVWVDAVGRVLKVRIPSEQLVALRDELPR